MRVDLHTHSTASDGTDGPADLARLARDAALDGFALTDHDTTAGLAATAQAAAKLGLRFVPGIELSVQPDPFATEDTLPAEDDSADTPAGALHLLGYHIREGAPELRALEEQQRIARATRNPRIVEKLQELGVRIEYTDVVATANPSDRAPATAPHTANAVGRPHIAQVLVNKGYVKSMHEAFSRYLGAGGPAYVGRELPTAAQAIHAIHAAGGAAVLAHPVHLGLTPAGLEHAVAKLADLGLDGIETRHSDHEVGDVRRLTALAERFDLIATGGSDYHGSRKAIALGSVLAPDDALDRLEEAAGQYA